MQENILSIELDNLVDIKQNMFFPVSQIQLNDCFFFQTKKKKIDTFCDRESRWKENSS